MSHEPNPFLVMMLDSSNFVGASEEMDSELLPLPEQFDIGPGTKAILASSSTPLDEDFTILEVIDPAECAETFPDWERRIGSYVLASSFSAHDKEFSIGWFARVKLVQITEEQYAECLRMRELGFPDEQPEWVTKVYTNYTDALAVHDPARVPVLVTCPYCKQRLVVMHVHARRHLTAKVGEVTRNGKLLYTPVSDTSEEQTHYATLECENPECGAKAELTDEEWEL